MDMCAMPVAIGPTMARCVGCPRGRRAAPVGPTGCKESTYGPGPASRCAGRAKVQCQLNLNPSRQASFRRCLSAAGCIARPMRSICTRRRSEPADCKKDNHFCRPGSWKRMGPMGRKGARSDLAVVRNENPHTPFNSGLAVRRTGEQSRCAHPNGDSDASKRDLAPILPILAVLENLLPPPFPSSVLRLHRLQPKGREQL